MPSIEYFKSATVTLVSVSFIFNMMVGIYGINKMTFRKSIPLLILGFVLAAYTTYISAEQAEKSDKVQTDNKEQSKRLESTINDIHEIMMSFIQSSHVPMPITDENKKQLAERTASLANELYNFVSEERRASSNIDVRRETWNEDTKKITDQFYQSMSYYNQNYSGKAIALYDDLKKANILEDDPRIDTRLEHTVNDFDILDIANLFAKTAVKLKLTQNP